MAKEIKLTNGMVAIVDDEFYEKLSRYNWYYDGKYARCIIDGKNTAMHHLVLKPPPGLQTDHINGNKLDNRKENLRNSTQSQNMANRRVFRNNTTGYKGVYRENCTGKWRAIINKDGVSYSLGLFQNKHAAALAYNKAALKYFGEFALLNDIPSDVDTTEPKKKYRGVLYDKTTGKWRTRLWHNKVQIDVGTYDNPEDAARAYNVAALKYKGPRARLNEIDFEGFSIERTPKKSQYRGVRTRNGERWYAEIKVNGKGVYLGSFNSEIEAARAYNEAALKYHGDKAKLNEIPDETE